MDGRRWLPCAGAAHLWPALQDFCYDGREHHCIAAPHVIHVFSMSKVRATLHRRLTGVSSECG